MDSLVTNTIWENAFSGDLDLILEILKDNPKTCNIQDKNGNTPLIFACMGDRIEVIHALILAGGNIHIKNRAGVNALYFAKGSQRRVEILKFWEASTPEAKALAAAETDEKYLVSILKSRREKEFLRHQQIKHSIKERHNFATTYRLTRELTYRITAKMLSAAIDFVSIAICEFDYIFDRLFIAVDIRENTRIKKRRDDEAKRLKELRDKANKLVMEEAQRKFQQDEKERLEALRLEAELERERLRKEAFEQELEKQRRLHEIDLRRKELAAEIERLREVKEQIEFKNKLEVLKRMRKATSKIT